jgi:hypothetical protein
MLTYILHVITKANASAFHFWIIFLLVLMCRYFLTLYVRYSCSVCQGKICRDRDIMDACWLLYRRTYLSIYAAAFPQQQREWKRGTTRSSLYSPFLREFLVYVCSQFTVGESKRGTTQVVFLFPLFKGNFLFMLAHNSQLGNRKGGQLRSWDGGNNAVRKLHRTGGVEVQCGNVFLMHCPPPPPLHPSSHLSFLPFPSRSFLPALSFTPFL